MDQELHVTMPSYEDEMSNNRSIVDIVDLVSTLVDWISICIELPLICWAIFALYRRIKADNLTPVYVINLLVSDIVQIIGRVGDLIYQHEKSKVPYWMIFSIFFFGVVASGAFMLCIALERYMCIVHPLWFRTRRGIKQTVLLSLAAWVGSVLITVLQCILMVFHLWGISLTIVTLMFIPFLLHVYFLVAIWRALTPSITVPVPMKKRIRRIIVLVLGNYTMVILPTIFVNAYEIKVSDHYWFWVYGIIFDMLLYISRLIDILVSISLFPSSFPPCFDRLICCQESREMPPIHYIPLNYRRLSQTETECDESESLRLEPLQLVSDTSV